MDRGGIRRHSLNLYEECHLLRHIFTLHVCRLDETYFLSIYTVSGSLPCSPGRLRQICDALTAAQKMAPCPGTATVVCGDFNSAGHTAVHEVLVTESVTALAVTLR